MNTYKVKITETLEKVVEVKAKNRIEAEQIVCSAWHSGAYALKKKHFVRINFAAELLPRKRESYER